MTTSWAKATDIGLPVILAAIVLCPLRLRADTLFVPADFETIQSAIDAASDGDVVLVAAGTYLEQIDFLGKALTVESESDAEATIIDGDPDRLGVAGGSVVTLAADDVFAAVLEGFTLRGGTGSEVEGSFLGIRFLSTFGGGIYCRNAEATVRNCIIDANRADAAGGGIYAEDAALTLEDSTLSANEAPLGGGLYADGSGTTVLLTGCRVSGNGAGDFGSGGGLLIHAAGAGTLVACELADNSAFVGGGCYFSDTAVVLDAVTLTGNGASFGGGLAMTMADVLFLGSILRDNAADLGGAALHDGGGELTLEACLIASNDADEGGGLHGAIAEGLIRLTNCTLTENSANIGSVVRVPYDSLLAPSEMRAELTNCIAWGIDDNPFEVSGELVVTYCDVEGGISGAGNIDGDPDFVSSVAGDYRLQPDSPCIDAGSPTSPPDEDGTTRDMGAFPFSERFLRGDVDGDGTVFALADALRILSWQFSDKAEPPCHDAADADDNGEMEALVDGIFLLTWQFQVGVAPPAPGPEACGEDPTDDALGCAELATCR